MKYLSALMIVLVGSVVSAQSGDDCYPGLGLCEDAVTSQMPLPSRINIGTPEDSVTSNENSQSSSESTTNVQPATPTNPICIVYDVRPPDAWLALRTEPSTKRGTRLYKLPSGTKIEMLGPQEGNWHLVRVSDGAVGWVSWYRDRWIAC